MPCREQPRYPVHRRTKVVTTPLLGHTGVQSHAHPYHDVLAPYLGKECPLGGERGLQSMPAIAEGSAAGVAYHLEDVAFVGLYGALQDLVVAGEGILHLGGIVLPHGGPSRYIGKKEGDRAAGYPGRSPGGPLGRSSARRSFGHPMLTFSLE